MAEPTGQTIDGTPWEEARPPHVPDRLTAVSPWIIPFLLVAAWEFWTVWSQRPQTDPVPTEWWGQLLGIVPSMSMALIGAALFLRHPDAWRSLRLVAAGAFLLLLEMALDLGKPFAGTVIQGSDPSVESFERDVAIAVAYDTALGLVQVIGLALIAVGLDRTRQSPSRFDGRWLLLGVPALGIGLSIVTRVAWEDATLLGSFLPQALAALAFGVAFDLALAYVLVVGVRGRRAGGRDRLPWTMLAAGAAVMVASRVVLAPIAALWFAADQTVDLLAAFSIAGISGYLLLLAAFVAGLPPTDVDGATPGPPAVTTPGSAAG